jgi:hypothetical protein
VKKLVDEAVKWAPTKYGALAWGVMSFGLGLAIEQHNLRKLVLNSSDFLTHILARYASYERVYRNQITAKKSTTFDNFENNLVDVYKAVLVYAGAVNKYIQQLGIGIQHIPQFPCYLSNN